MVTSPADAMLWGEIKQGIDDDIMKLMILLSKILTFIGSAWLTGISVILAINWWDELIF